MQENIQRNDRFLCKKIKYASFREWSPKEIDEIDTNLQVKGSKHAMLSNFFGQYDINDMQNEPAIQHQNPAEKMIQEVKSMTAVLMDRSGSPKYHWFICMLNVLQVHNCLTHPKLGMRTPMEAALGYTLDISVWIYNENNENENEPELDVYDKEQQEIAETLHEPDINPIIPDTRNDEGEDSDDKRNDEAEESDDNMIDDTEKREPEQAQVRATRHSTNLQNQLNTLIQQDDLNTVGKKVRFLGKELYEYLVMKLDFWVKKGGGEGEGEAKSWNAWLCEGNVRIFFA